MIDDEAEAKAAFYLRMRARGIQDRQVLRAFELVPRKTFVPERYLDLAARDLAVPIGCGQTLLEPWLVARMIVALEVEPSHRVLEIGAGTGYASAILSHLAGEVFAFERYQSLAVAAQDKIVGQGIANATIVWGDGLSLPPRLAAFDRIIVHGCVNIGRDGLLDHLVAGGILVCALARTDGQIVVKLTKTDDGIREEPICPCRLQAIVPGLANGSQEG